MEIDLKTHQELHDLYSLICKLVIVCCERNIKLIIENPYSMEHYLTRYWALRSTIIDTDRRDMGDYYKKPTQYFFVNCEPANNFIFEAIDIQPKKHVHLTHDQVERSMISPEYARRFIRTYIVEKE